MSSEWKDQSTCSGSSIQPGKNKGQPNNADFDLEIGINKIAELG